MCTHGQYQCTLGDCILLQYVCDGETDCPNDSSDEDFCGKLHICFVLLDLVIALQLVVTTAQVKQLQKATESCVIGVIHSGSFNYFSAKKSSHGSRRVTEYWYMWCDLGKPATCRSGQFCRYQRISRTIVNCFYFLSSLIIRNFGFRYTS